MPPPSGQKRAAPKDRILVCRVVPHNGGLVFAEESRAKAIAALHRALRKARTWAEFWAMVPKAEYSYVIRTSFDDLGEARPKGSDRFSPNDVAGFSDGDYPPWLQQEMDAVLPPSILQRFGTRADTVLNGSFLMIPPENARGIIDELKERGVRVRSARKLRLW